MGTYEFQAPICIFLIVLLLGFALTACDYAHCLNDNAINDPTCDALTDPDITELLQRNNDGEVIAIWNGNVELNDGYNKDMDFTINFDDRSIRASDEGVFELDATYEYNRRIYLNAGDTTTYKGVSGTITNGRIDLDGLRGNLQYDDITGNFTARP